MASRRLHYTPDALVVPVESPYKTYQDFVKATQANPGALSIAGSALHSANHVAHERLNRDFRIKTTYVPFKGTGDLVSAVLGSHVAATMSYTTFAIQQKGKVRMLAVATKERAPQFPDVPTFKELGIDWIDGAYRGVAVPKSTPEAVSKQVSDMMETLNKDPDMRKADGRRRLRGRRRSLRPHPGLHEGADGRVHELREADGPREVAASPRPAASPGTGP